MKNLIKTSIKRKVTVAMFTIAVILFGLVSFTRLKINLLPELTYPTVTVRTEYEGAAPAEIENLITKPLEEALGTVKNVQEISSISRSGQSDVILEFAWGTDMDFSILEIREKIDAIELPLEIQRPSILRFDPSLDPIIRMGFSAKDKKNKHTGFNEEKLKFLRRYAEEEIKKDLESGIGVAAVKISGGLEDEIQVLVDQMKLANLNLNIESIANILRAENVNLSGGRLEEGTHQFLVRTLNQFKSVEEIGNVIIAHKNGAPIYLKDIATVKHGYKERKAISRIDGKEAVEIAIYKEGDANTVKVSNEVDKHLKRVKEKLPQGVEIKKVYDQSVFINQAVNEVINAAIIGGILAVIILYLFLRSFWTTVIISLSIPVSVIATFNLMYGANLSLNIMSLGGIALGIGMLVDNSIVVLENISRHKEQGKDNKNAAKDGASEVSTAVTASTLTTIAVFFPLVFVKGIAGQLFSDQALTITFALLASLFVALTLIPMLASIQKKEKQTEILTKTKQPKTKAGRWFRNIRIFIFTTIPSFIVKITFKIIKLISRLLLFIINPLLKIFNKVYTKIENRYPDLLKWSLKNKGTTLFIAFFLFLVSILLIPFMGIELIPQLSQGEFNIEFQLPPGTSLEDTDKLISSFQNKIKTNKNIKTSFSVAGSGNRLDSNPEHGGENWGELNISMKQETNREIEQETISEIRNNLEKVPGVQYKIYRPTLFSFKTPVEIEVYGYNLDKLKDYSKKIIENMRDLNRFADVKSSIEKGHPEIQIRFDRERASALGLNVYQIANLVVNKVRGNVASRYSWRDRKIDILVRVKEDERASVRDIHNLIVNPESDKPITLDSVANIIEGVGPSEIRRTNQQRVSLITANLNYGDLGTAVESLNSIIKKIDFPDDIIASVSGQNKEMKVSFKSLQFALLLAIFLVYLVMASQFESFLHPFVIIFTIPLALIGAIFALYITDSKISIVVFIGAILLAGIVVNNAIVLLDLINQLRAKGKSKTQAIIEGGKSRMRPIIITMLTTTLGLLPLAIGLGEGAEVRAPMAITVIGGLIVSTMLTLIVIPVVYSILDRKK